MCGFCNEWVYVMFCNVCSFVCVVVFMCWFCNIWVCVSVVVCMCEFCNLCVCLYVGFVM